MRENPFERGSMMAVWFSFGEFVWEIVVTVAVTVVIGELLGVWDWL